VVEEVVRWLPLFESGQVRLVGRGKPELAPGEHWAARRHSVGISRRDPRVSPSQWEPRPGSTGLWARPQGAAYATDQRMLVKNGTRLVQEWRWDALHAVRVTSDWRGIMLAATPEDTEVDVVAVEWNRWVIGAAPNLRDVAATWLKFEAAFAASHGRLDSWMEHLPDRLAQARAGTMLRAGVRPDAHGRCRDRG
jgi:hypothetical protein